MTSETTPVGRRVVLGMLGLGAAGVVVGRPVADAVDHLLAADPTGLASIVPGGTGFRFYSVVGSVDTVSPADYRLPVSGLVDAPLVLSYADLLDLPQAGITADFQCVTGWRVKDVPWKGVLLRDVIDAAGVSPRAGAVQFTSFDGAYTDSLTLEQARRDDVLVATEMLGAPVTHDHGGPVRLYVAPMYGYKSVKWLGGIELTRDAEDGYWEQAGYDRDAWVGGSNGRHDDPTA